MPQVSIRPYILPAAGLVSACALSGASHAQWLDTGTSGAGPRSTTQIGSQPHDVEYMIKPLCSMDPVDPPGPVVGGWDVLILDQDAIDALNASRGKPVAVITSGGGSGVASRGTGLTVVFNAFGDVSPDAMDAMQLTADYYATRIDDPITVTLNVTFDPGFFGGAGPAFINIGYSQLRQALIDDADADDTIQSLLPFGSVNARRALGGPVSQETEFRISTANARALGIDVVTVDAELFISSQADGDPSDGLGNGAAVGGSFFTYSLTDILVHEVGHSLGFLNVIEFGRTEMTPLDLFRFAELGADNPDTPAEFTSNPRALYIGGFSASEQHQFDFIEREHLASNASAFQASHFRETNFGDPTAPRVGVMEPAITPLETGFPEYFSIGDFDAFDAIGWDYVAADDVCPADVNGDGDVTDSDFFAWVTAFIQGLPECDVNLDEICSDSDFFAWVTIFIAGDC